MSYRCIVADPPWPQRGAGALRGRRGWVDAYSAPSRPMPYSVMTVDEIAAMPVTPGPYLELFARRMRMGWDAWGDQAPESIAWAAS